MAAIKVLGLGTLVVLVSGCQSWQYRDIEDLPPTAAIPDISVPGKVDVWYYDGITGKDVQSLLSATSYPDSPSEIAELNQLRQTVNRAENYGTLIRGYIEPPATGEYYFHVSGDDETQFWLAPSQAREGIVRIASTTAVPIDSFNRFSSQTSGVQFLEAGRKYYFELIHKEGRYDDHFTVAWTGPGFAQTVLDGQYLHSYAETIAPSRPELTPEEAYALGYKIGYFDAEQGLAFGPAYPPLDEDNDGLYDNWEVVYGLNPADPSDAMSDYDDDLLTALDEFMIRTRPDRADTDGDGLPDGYEYAYGLDPNDARDASLDSDGDGFTALEEYLAGTDPTDPSAFPVRAAVYEPGFVGQYFLGTDFNTFVYTQRDPTVNFAWGDGGPAGVATNRFSVRWQGQFTPPHAEGARTYTVATRTDDGVRLFIDQNIAIDRWVRQSPTTHSTSVTLLPEESVFLTMEYFENLYGATASLSITDASTGQLLDINSVVDSPRLDDDYSGSRLEDGISDTYKLNYGLPILQPVADRSFNTSGITVREAYQSGLHPYTLEQVSEPEPPLSENVTNGASSTVTLSWTAPSTRVDGSSISLSEIDYYQITYGQAPDALTETIEVESDLTSHTIEGLASGTWYFSIQVVDTNGLTSEPSEAIEFQVQ